MMAKIEVFACFVAHFGRNAESVATDFQGILGFAPIL